MSDSAEDLLLERRQNAGAGLLGLSEQPITSGDRAYFRALGVDNIALDEMIEEIRKGETAVMRIVSHNR